MQNITNIIREANPAAPLAVDEEAALVRAAQAGREGAQVALLAQYAPAARNALARFRGLLDEEDAVQEVALAMLDVIVTHDAERGDRLAGRMKARLTAHLSAAAGAASGGWSIPSRTLDRYHGLLRRAGGDLAAAEALAPEHEMAAETFRAVTAALRSTDSLSDGFLTDDGERETATYALDGGAGDPFGEVDDAHLAEYLLSVVSPDEKRVTRHAYGFDVTEVDGQVVTPEGAAPLSDALVGASLGFSRPRTQRLRASALKRMRGALALDEG